MAKFIFSIIMQFFLGRSSNSGSNSQAQLLNSVVTVVKKELSALILKIFIGLVATGVLIYSVVILGQYFHGFLLRYQNGNIFSVLFFVILSAGCIFLISQLFYEKKKQEDLFTSLFSKTTDKGHSFQKIYTTFLDGLNTGLKQTNTKENATEEKKSEPESKPQGFTH